MKKSKGAADVEVRREEGVVDGVVGSEIKVVVGSSWFWRWRRFESIVRNC